MQEAGLPHEGLDGKFDGHFKVTLPLLADLPASSVKVEGKAKISDGRAKDLLGPYNIQGAGIDLDITEKAADASGQMLVNGVLAKLSWQRIFDAPLDKQPPLRITATLDNNDRTQLGLDVNHIVQGEVPVELTITRGQRDAPAIRLRADLANADLVLENVAWRKPPGRSATLQCDIVQGRDDKMELQNFKVAGDDVAIEGWAAIGADNRLREFYFPDFSLERRDAHGGAGHARARQRLEGEGARAHLRRPRFLPLAVLARPARRPAPQTGEAARRHRSGGGDRHRDRLLGGVAAGREAEARQARGEAHGARRARHARRGQAARRGIARGEGPAAQAAGGFRPMPVRRSSSSTSIPTFKVAACGSR